MPETKNTSVYVITPQGHRITGRVINDEHTEIVTTSRSWGEPLKVITVEWDDGDITDERIQDVRFA